MPCRPSPILPTHSGLVLAALSLAVALAGCRSQYTPRDFPGKPGLRSSAQPGSGASTFSSPRDDLGREIKLESPARRVLVIGPGAVETIFALGAGERIVGRDSAADFPPAIKKVAVVADFNGPFIEACIAQRPDLVLVQGETWGRDRVEGWQKKIGAPVAALAPTTVAMVTADKLKIAAWLGVKPRGDSINPLLKSVYPAPRRRAFIEISRSPLWTAGQGTLVSDVVEQGQFRNVAADVSGYKAFSKEALLQRQPDIYITTGKPEDKARILSELKRDAALGALKCVQRGQVLVIPSDFLLRPGPRLRDGIRALQKAAQSPDRPSEW